MLGTVQKLVQLPNGSAGLALEGNKLRVLGVDNTTASSYLDSVRAAWADIVRTDALATLYGNGTAALRDIREELAEAQEAEAIGVPPPGGRSSATLEQILSQGRATFKSVYDSVSAAATVADINAVLGGSRDQGLTWLVHTDWEPYPEECPWQVA